MKHIALFENFEIVDPIIHGEHLNNKEINFLQGYNIMCPEWILKDDNYYYVFNHRCENIKDVPATYINAVCKEFNIKNYTINDDYTIDVDGGVDFYIRDLYKIPLKFNIVRGSFDCSKNKLTTLEGSPKFVGTNFFCYDNELTTLEGCPKRIGSDFWGFQNNLTTLKGGPTFVGGTFNFSQNKVTTLEGAPEYVGKNFISDDNQLEYKGVIKRKKRWNI
jgi:hypothetical protein